MTITLDPVQLVLGGAAVLVAAALLLRKLVQLDRVVHAAAKVINRELKGAGLPDATDAIRRELNPNGGTSMKDDATGLAVAVGWLGRHFDQLREDLDNHLQHHDDQETR